MKGGGLSIHDGRQEVKASDVGRAFSRSNMEKRLGKLSAHRFRVFHTDSALPVAPVPDPAGPAVEEREAVLPPEAPEPESALPATVGVQFDQAFAAVLDGERQRLGDSSVRLRVDRAEKLLREALAAHALVRARSAATAISAPAWETLRRYEAAERRATDDRARLRSALEGVYAEDSEKIATRINSYQTQFGAADLRLTLRRSPHAFGQLRREYPGWGLGVVWSTRRARLNVERLISAVEVASESRAALPGREVFEAAKEYAHRVGKAATRARELCEKVGHPAAFERRAADVLRPLVAAQGVAPVRQQLAQLLPMDECDAAQTLERVLQSAATKHNRERARGPEIDFA